MKLSIPSSACSPYPVTSLSALRGSFDLQRLDTAVLFFFFLQSLPTRIFFSVIDCRSRGVALSAAEGAVGNPDSVFFFLSISFSSQNTHQCLLFRRYCNYSYPPFFFYVSFRLSEPQITTVTKKKKPQPTFSVTTLKYHVLRDRWDSKKKLLNLLLSPSLNPLFSEFSAALNCLELGVQHCIVKRTFNFCLSSPPPLCFFLSSTLLITNFFFRGFFC